MDILLLTDHSTQRSTIRINVRTQLSSHQVSPQKNTCNCELKAETFLQLYNMDAHSRMQLVEQNKALLSVIGSSSSLAVQNLSHMSLEYT